MNILFLSALLAICSLGLIYGYRLQEDFRRHQYDAACQRVKSQAAEILRAAPGYSWQQKYLDGLLESRFAEARKAPRPDPIDEADIPRIFYLMESDAGNDSNRDAISTLDYIVNKLFRHESKSPWEADVINRVKTLENSSVGLTRSGTIPDFEQKPDFVFDEFNEGPRAFRCLWNGFNMPVDRMIEIDLYFDPVYEPKGNVHNDPDYGKCDKDTVMCGQWDHDQQQVTYTTISNDLPIPPEPGDGYKGTWVQIKKGDPNFEQLAKDLWNGSLYIKFEGIEDMLPGDRRHILMLGNVVLSVQCR